MAIFIELTVTVRNKVMPSYADGNYLYFESSNKPELTLLDFIIWRKENETEIKCVYWMR